MLYPPPTGTVSRHISAGTRNEYIIIIIRSSDKNEHKHSMPSPTLRMHWEYTQLKDIDNRGNTTPANEHKHSMPSPTLRMHWEYTQLKDIDNRGNTTPAKNILNTILNLSYYKKYHYSQQGYFALSLIL